MEKLKVWMKGLIEKIKPKKLYWLVIMIYLILSCFIIIILWHNASTSQPSEADVYFDLVMLAEFELVGSDGDNYSHHVKVSGYLTVKSEDGPLTSGRPIYGDKWRFRYVPDFPEGHDIENFRLNFSLGSPDGLDRSDTDISIPIKDLKSYEMDDIIYLSKENGYLQADWSGVKQLRLEARWNYIGQSHDNWEYSEYTNLTKITLKSYEDYPDTNLITKSDVTVIVTIYVAVPAIILPLKKLYEP